MRNHQAIDIKQQLYKCTKNSNTYLKWSMCKFNREFAGLDYRYSILLNIKII